MANRTTGASPGVRTPRSANERWKSRWSTWLTRSTVVAACVHAIVFIIFPVWEITRPREDERQVELIQITPVAGYGGVENPGEGIIAALPTEEEMELAREEAGDLLEQESADEVRGVRLPDEAFAYVPEIVTESMEGQSVERSRALIYERLIDIAPTVTAAVNDVGWPQIRNPTVITRFLRTRFNAMHRELGTSGYVAVAMWIDERGDVEWARVSQSSGDDALDGIALALFENVVAFSPARSRGRGVPVQVTISVPFMLPW